MLNHSLSSVLATLCHNMFKRRTFSFGLGSLRLWFMAGYISSRPRRRRTHGKRVWKNRVVDLIAAKKQGEEGEGPQDIASAPKNNLGGRAVALGR